jgi:hypothetical protein
MLKFETAKLPKDISEAIEWAEQREENARACREKDMNGSAREFELVALLLRYWADKEQEKAK